MGISILGINLKRIRKARGLSAYRLAKMAGVGNSVIAEIESGVRQNLNTKTIEKLSAALNVPVEELYITPVNEEFVVSDITEAFSVILESDELTLDESTLTKEEKEKLHLAFNIAIESIRKSRE